MRGGRIIFIIILSAVTVAAMAQKVRVAAVDEPLSSVVKRLNVEVSFDNSVLSKYRVTLNRTFSSPQKAIGFLIAGKPLLLKKEAGVYIISVRKDNVVKKHEERAGKVITRSRLDTLSMDLSVSLKEIVITSKWNAPRIEEEASSSRGVFFNTAAAIRMPGYSDNSVFNVLRMMPGIRASGEPSDELYVWGSSPGESRVTLDGIPLFTMQSYNSNISYINPYMSEEVRYKRGIMSATDGSQTGAKVDVISSTSQVAKPVFKAMVSTMSANVFGAVPLGSKCMVSVAYRHTLESVFNGTTFDAYRKRDNMQSNQSRVKSSADGAKTTTPIVPANTSASTTIPSNTSETNTSTGNTSTTNPPATNPYSPTSNAATDSSSSTTITPKYTFQDVNMHITGVASGNLMYKISMYGAKDYLDYDSDDTLNTRGDQTSYQGGISASVSKAWQDGNKSELS